MNGHPPDYSVDPRIEQILEILPAYAAGDYRKTLAVSPEGDEIDAIITGLNAIAGENLTTRKLTRHNLDRIENILAALLRYTVLDFSQTLEVSKAGDEIDAIAVGLNSMAEELESSRKLEKKQLQVISDGKKQIEVIINNAPSAVVVIDEEGSIVDWNTKASEIFGWNQDEVMYKPMHELIMPPRYHSQHTDGVKRFINTGEGPILNKLIELTALRKTGEEFPIEIAISAVKSGKKFLFTAFINDISERKRSERILLETNRELEVSNRELEAFTYSASHDLRTPLRAISGYSQLLSERFADVLNDSGQTLIKAIRNNILRMEKLIDDLLALSKYSRSEVDKSDVDMNEVVEAVIAGLAESKPMDKFNIVVHAMPHVHADRNLIYQVYTNLISNAVKYSSGRRNPEIEVGSQQKGEETIFYVKDNGVGFDMEFYNKLFGVFQRLHDPDEFDGTGVGLAIVQRIIAKHDGRVWAESELNKGSTFYFVI